MVQLFVLRVTAVARGEVYLAAENRLYVAAGARTHELDGAEHVPAVGQGDGRHPHLADVLDQRRDSDGSVQHRELAVDVKVNEFCRHEPADHTAPGASNPPLPGTLRPILGGGEAAVEVGSPIRDRH